MKSSGKSIVTHLIWALCAVAVAALVFHGSYPFRHFWPLNRRCQIGKNVIAQPADRPLSQSGPISDSALEEKVKTLISKGLEKANVLVDQIEPQSGKILTLDEKFGDLERSVREVQKESLKALADSDQREGLSDAWDDALQSLREARQQVERTVSLSKALVLSDREEVGPIVTGRDDSVSQREGRYSRREDIARLWKGAGCNVNDHTWAQNGSIVIDDVDYLTAPAAERPALRARFFSQLDGLLQDTRAELDENLTGPAVIGKPIAAISMKWARSRIKNVFDKTDALLNGE